MNSDVSKQQEWSYELFLDKLVDIHNDLSCLIEKDLDDRPVNIETEYGMDARGNKSSVASSNMSKREVVFSMLSNQFLWYVCWYGYHFWNNNLQILDTADFQKRLRTIDANEEEILTMSCQTLDSWNADNLAWIFAYATNFILFHEIGHIVKGHTPEDENHNTKSLPERRAMEYEADEYAMKAIMEVGQNRNQSLISNIGVVCAQSLLFFEKKKDEDYVNSIHGDPMDRIEQKLQMIGDNTNKYRKLVAKLKQQADLFMARKYGQEIS